MQNEIKVIANYLPQYHSIPENDKWWGEGFVDWIPVKKAIKLFKGHKQPRVPLNNHYYLLDDIDEIKWQVNLAKNNGIYGFGIYHYWFSSDLYLLGKPAEMILNHPEIDIPFLFLWDNATWKRTWSNVKHANDWAPTFDSKEIEVNQKKDKTNGILAELVYGTKNDWKKHFLYLLPFFKDSRYIKLNNMPIFGFFQPNNDFEKINEMTEYWNDLAKDSGFDGILCMTRDNYMKKNLEYKFRYTPLVPNDKASYMKYKIKDIYAKKTGSIRFYDYDKCWKTIIDEAKKSDAKTFLSGFVQFDDTPRRGKNGRVIKGDTPDKFKKYMKELLDISKIQNKEYVFVTAWNEWSEGAYLEPDSTDKMNYLKALKEAIELTNEE